MTNEKIFASEIIFDTELNNISGGIPKIQMAPERFTNPRTALYRGIGKLISDTITYFFEKNKKTN